MVENPLLQFKQPYDVTEAENIEINSDAVIENIFTPNEFSNIIITVEDIELHLNKDTLRMYSPVFKFMLGNNFLEGASGRIKLPGKKANNMILFLSFFYPDRTIPLKDKVDYYDLLQLCDEYQAGWVKEKINDHIVQRVKIFHSGGRFVHDTKIMGDFEYRYQDFEYSKADDKRSYDDTLVIYFTYLAERFDLEVLLYFCREYIFELELYYLQKIKIFELLSKQSKYYIYRYCISRGVASQGRETDPKCEKALRDCIVDLTDVQSESYFLTSTPS